MIRLIAGLLLFFAGAAEAQQGQAVGPTAPCSAFGTASGTCAQGNDIRFGVITAQGRLTLTANTPVMTATASAQTTLRYDCYLGNTVPYFNGTVDTLDTVASCEVTDAMVSAASAGQVVNNNVYDVWWVTGGANKICLAMSAAVGGGGGWSADTAGSNTARGTGYTQLDRITRPYITNKNSITNCFNGATNYGPVSANQGTYLGTVYSSANGQVSWTLGASASGGTAGLLGVWNMYNRVNVATTVTDSGASYTYAVNTVRQARASAGNQVSFISGLAEDGVSAFYAGETTLATILAAGNWICIGLDITSNCSSQRFIATNDVASTTPSYGQFAYYIGAPQVGLHVLSANEATNSGANANTFDTNSLNAFSVNLRM
jgi:hypothetical protein